MSKDRLFGRHPRRHFERIVILCSLLGTVSPAVAQDKTARAEPSPEVKAKIHDLVEDVYESEVELKVVFRRSKLLKMRHDIFRAAVADPSIIEIVAFGSREIEIIGKETGSTTLTLWMGAPEQARLLSVLVTVTRDTAVEERRRLEYGELQTMLNEMFPNSKLQLIPIADKLIVRGEARDEQEAAQIMSIIREQSIGLVNGANGYYDAALTAQGAVSEPFPDAGKLPKANVVNMLTIPGVKQIMLKVRIAELKRSALRELGADFNFEAGDVFFESIMAGGGNILTTGTFDDDSFNLVLNAIINNGSAKILAEPNLVVLSGHTASFLAGGEFAVPTVVGVGGAEAATTQFKGFGTQLTFTPTVLDKDRVRLQVVPTFSTLNSDNSVNGIFGLDTRTVSTMVELREGQVLAIAGLLQEQQRGENSRVPILGDISLLNSIFSNKSISRDETELIVLVSPELVHPMEPEDAPSILPGMEVTEPDDYDFFIHGFIEGAPECHHRSTVWPWYRDRNCKGRLGMHRRACAENYYINGPCGFSN